VGSTVTIRFWTEGSLPRRTTIIGFPIGRQSANTGNAAADSEGASQVGGRRSDCPPTPFHSWAVPDCNLTRLRHRASRVLPPESCNTAGSPNETSAAPTGCSGSPSRPSQILYELPSASYRGPFPTRRPPALGTLIRGPSSTLPVRRDVLNLDDQRLASRYHAGLQSFQPL
jgi:hypothetical protein